MRSAGLKGLGFKGFLCSSEMGFNGLGSGGRVQVESFRDLCGAKIPLVPSVGPKSCPKHLNPKPCKPYTLDVSSGLTDLEQSPSLQSTSVVLHTSLSGPRRFRVQGLLEGAGGLVRVPKGLLKGIYRVPEKRDLWGLGFRVYLKGQGT